MSVTFVVPCQSRASGGHTYNTAIVEALRRAGWRIATHHLDGDWPHPTATERSALRTILRTSDVVVLDGLIGSCCPEEVNAATPHTRVLLLVHLPLPAELGLTAAEAARLADLERQAVRAATAVITTSRWAADDVRRRYGRESVVVRPGTHPAQIAQGSSPPHLLMLAAVTPVKNHRTALAALAELGDRAWRLTLVGAHPDPATSRDLLDRVAKSPVAERITVTGELTGERLDAVWADTDLLLVPSLTETFGLVVTEALSRGIPAVVAKGTGAVEALGVQEPDTASATDPGDRAVAGVALDPRQPAAWAATLRHWLTDPDLRHGWRAAALERRLSLGTWAEAANDFARAIGSPV